MAKTFYNLPEKVIFCKKCCVSNQRPNSSPEFKKKDATIDTVGFKDEETHPNIKRTLPCPACLKV